MAIDILADHSHSEVTQSLVVRNRFGCAYTCSRRSGSLHCAYYAPLRPRGCPRYAPSIHHLQHLWPTPCFFVVDCVVSAPSISRSSTCSCLRQHWLTKARGMNGVDRNSLPVGRDEWRGGDLEFAGSSGTLLLDLDMSTMEASLTSSYCICTESCDPNLDLLRCQAFGPTPWSLTFSYGRALQSSTLKMWAGKVCWLYRVCTLLELDLSSHWKCLEMRNLTRICFCCRRRIGRQLRRDLLPWQKRTLKHRQVPALWTYFSVTITSPYCVSFVKRKKLFEVRQIHQLTSF